MKLRSLLAFGLTSSLVFMSSCSSLGKKGERVDVTPTDKAATDANSPALTSPIVRKVWIGPRIEGDRYYEGHFMYVIERGSIWKMQ